MIRFDRFDSVRQRFVITLVLDLRFDSDLIRSDSIDSIQYINVLLPLVLDLRLDSDLIPFRSDSIRFDLIFIGQE